MKSNQGRAGGVRRAAVVVSAVVGIAALVLTWALDRSGLAHPGSAASEALMALRISEVQTHNALTLLSEDGSAPDWIEIENTGSGRVSLHGVCLARDARFNKTFAFPDIALEPGEYALVYADGKAAIGADGTLHAGFRLPSAGGTALYLFDAAQRLLDSVEIPALAVDESWARDASGEWALSAQATPGAPNAMAAARGMTILPGDVGISEAMCDNRTEFPDEDGQCGDYVELHNLTGGAVRLGGYWLSDSAARPNKWALPNVTLPADGCLAIHCTGADRREDPNHLHAAFKLSAGETVYLTAPGGAVVSAATLPETLACGQAWSLSEGGWTDALAPTPNLPNTFESARTLDAQAVVGRARGLCIGEVMAAPEDEAGDWIEIVNGGPQAVDLGGCGLSDRPDHPRKWQFPAGTAIAPGERLTVSLTGSGSEAGGGALSAPFALAADGGYAVCLSDPQGALLDHLFIPQQYPGISYGRSDAGACGYFETPTPGAANGGAALLPPAGTPAFSQPGGLFTSGQSFSVALSAEAGARIFYTLDCSDPTESSTPYAGPIAVSGTAVIRARAYREGCLPSIENTQSYLYDVNAASDAPYVVSLVSDPEGLYSDESGIMVKGPNATEKFPYGTYGEGANFWMDWEREAHVELFVGATGETALSQACGIKLHGRNTRAYELKSFKVMARGRYGDALFRYPIFHDRPWEEYEGFILRYSGQDYKSAFMRDAVLTAAAADTSVMYMEAEECICYLNGEYYSAMYIRENISPFSLARREGWTGQEKAVDLVKSGYEVKQGSNESYIALKTWLDSHDNATRECYDMVTSCVDVNNFAEYAAMQIILGPPDTVNVKRYRNTLADGKWRWVIYDVDRAMRDNINGFELLAQGTNAQLFRACMANPDLREIMLAELNRALSTYMSSQALSDAVAAQFERLKPLLPDYLGMMGISQKSYASNLKSLNRTIGGRPAEVLEACASYLHLSQAEMEARFADAYAAIRAYEGGGA